jgi:outer membrane lipoprotein SlyB
MSTTVLRKTHPMVLIAAAALTIFSLLGSAAITGLIPSAHSEKPDVVQRLTDGTGTAIANSQVTDKAPVNPEKEIVKPDHAPSAAKKIACLDCGKIVSIRTVEQKGEASGLGAVAGGVAGGVIGNQLGKGNGNTLMTVLGVGGGAYAGHTIEQKMKTHTAYLIKVRMQNGSYRMITQYSQPQHAVGDEVRLQNSQITSA